MPRVLLPALLLALPQGLLQRVHVLALLALPLPPVLALALLQLQRVLAPLQRRQRRVVARRRRCQWRGLAVRLCWRQQRGLAHPCRRQR
jgi:hypothetical protein